MDCFGLGYCEMEWGTSRMIMLKDKADGDALGYKQLSNGMWIMKNFENI